MKLEVPAGFREGTAACNLRVVPPAGAQAGEISKFNVSLPVVPTPPPLPPITREGHKAKHMRDYVTRRAAQLKLSYDTQPNKLNPLSAWPIREQLTFANLRPEYFELPEHKSRGLFRSMFGFPTWEGAMVVFEDIYAWDEHARRARKREEKAILAPRFQYLAALWRMRAHKNMVELAAFFGVSEQNMSIYVTRWIKRCGSYMKENVVIQPKDYASIVALMPQAYIDCGLGTIVAIGDCTDILTETSRESTLNSLRLRSSKTDHSAAMGLTWVSPNGAAVGMHVCSPTLADPLAALLRPESCRTCTSRGCAH